MQNRKSAAFTANPIPHTRRSRFGANRQPARSQPRLAERSEAQIVRWVQFPAGCCSSS